MKVVFWIVLLLLFSEVGLSATTATLKTKLCDSKTSEESASSKSVTQLPSNDLTADEEAVVQEFFIKNRRYYMGLFTILTRRPNMSEDLYQDLCLRLWRRRDQFFRMPPEERKKYANRAAGNMAINLHQRNHYDNLRVTTTIDMEEDGINALDIAEGRVGIYLFRRGHNAREDFIRTETLRLFFEEIDTLTADEKEAIQLRIFGQTGPETVALAAKGDFNWSYLSYEEIAEKSHKSESAVKSTLYRARLKLEAFVEGELKPERLGIPKGRNNAPQVSIP